MVGYSPWDRKESDTTERLYSERSLALPFFLTGMKLTFSSPVTTAEFSKFAVILGVFKFIYNTTTPF